MNFGTGSQFGTEVAKRYGEAERLVFAGKQGSETVQTVKNVMGNHELSPLMLYASHLFTRLHGLKNTLLAGLAPSCRKVEHYSG